MRAQILFLLTLTSSIFMTGCVTVPLFDQELQQVTIQQGSGFSPKKIAVIDISGVLTNSGSGNSFFDSDSSVVSLSKKLSMIKKDNRIEAVILRVNTPGGGVTASDIMYHEIQNFKEETGLPVYTSMQTVAASGGYYVSMASDRVYATPTTITGSIGVIGTFPEVKGLMDRFGVEMNAITSGENKDAGAFYKNMEPSERALYQGMIDDMYAQFISVIDTNRTNMTTEQLLPLADGRVYTANQALEVGLIDKIAYLDEVIDDVAKENGLSDPSIVIIRKAAGSSDDTIYAAQPQTMAPEYNLFKLDFDRWEAMGQNEVFNYIWMP